MIKFVKIDSENILRLSSNHYRVLFFAHKSDKLQFKRLYNLITVAGQGRIYAGLSPFFPTVFFRGNRFLHIYEVITTLVCLNKKL